MAIPMVVLLPIQHTEPQCSDLQNILILNLSVYKQELNSITIKIAETLRLFLQTLRMMLLGVI